MDQLWQPQIPAGDSPPRKPGPIGIFLVMRHPLARSAVKMIFQKHSEFKLVGESDQSPERGRQPPKSARVVVSDEHCIPRDDADRCGVIVRHGQYSPSVASAIKTGVRAIVDAESVENA